jgi:hypothetical protein
MSTITDRLTLVPEWVGCLRFEIDTAQVHFSYFEDRTESPGWEEVDEDIPSALRIQADAYDIDCARDYEWHVYRESGGIWNAIATLDEYALEDTAPVGRGSHPIAAIRAAIEGAPA